MNKHGIDPFTIFNLILLIFGILALVYVLSGCAQQTLATRTEVFPHDTVRVPIAVPGPTVFAYSPCDTGAILERYANFDIEKDTAGDYYRAQYDYLKHILNVTHHEKTDTILFVYVQKGQQFLSVWDRMKMVGEGFAFASVMAVLVVAWTALKISLGRKS
jgi:hypothetical protein